MSNTDVAASAVIADTNQSPRNTHTPGPWVAEEFTMKEHRVRAVAGKPIADIWLNGDDAAATARLIAAAPDLLERARIALQYLENKNFGGADRVCAASHLRDAIAKATAAQS